MSESQRSGRRLAGAVAGGLIAGLGITTMLMAGERQGGQPSELADLERTGARRVGLDPPAADTVPDGREQAIIQGGHLVLSAAAGAVYAVSVNEDAPVLASGIGFGLAFYAVAHWIAGPLLGLKQPEWRSDGKAIAMHTLNHVGFGLVTAIGARTASRI